jgi:hypothetical protein
MRVPMKFSLTAAILLLGSLASVPATPKNISVRLRNETHYSAREAIKFSSPDSQIPALKNLTDAWRLIRSLTDRLCENSAHGSQQSGQSHSPRTVRFD